MMQQTMSIETDEYNQLISQVETLTKRATGAERQLITAIEQAARLREALDRLALLKEDIPDEMADNAFVFDVPVWLIRQVREDLESALSAAPADSLSAKRAAFRAGAEAMRIQAENGIAVAMNGWGTSESDREFGIQLIDVVNALPLPEPKP